MDLWPDPVVPVAALSGDGPRPLQDDAEDVVVVLVPSAEHCIETVAKQEYRRCVHACLRSERPTPELGARLEILRRFLEQADLPRLRRESEALLRAGESVRFVVEGDEERVRWRMEFAPQEETR